VSRAKSAGRVSIVSTDHPTAPLSPCWLTGRREFEAFGVNGYHDADGNKRVDGIAGQGRLHFPLEVENGLLRPGARYAEGADLIVIAEIPPTGGAAPRATQYVCGHFRTVRSGGFLSGVETVAFSAGDFFQGARGRQMVHAELGHPVLETLCLPTAHEAGFVSGAVAVKLVHVAAETGLVCRTELRWTFASQLERA
jgi:hypothetical protein